MTTSHRIRALLAAAAASVLVLTACGGPDEETTTAPAPITDVEKTDEPSDEPTMTDSMPEESPMVEETPAPETGSTREPVSTGALDGEELNTVGVEWFDAFCGGIADAQAYAGTTSEDQTVAEVVDLAGTTYQKMGTSITATSDRIRGLESDMNFENADVFAAEVGDIFKEVGQIYWAAAETMETGTFSREEDFTQAVEEVSSDVVAAGGFDFGISSLDPSVTDAVAEVPACASL